MNQKTFFKKLSIDAKIVNLAFQVKEQLWNFKWKLIYIYLIIVMHSSEKAKKQTHTQKWLVSSTISVVFTAHSS